MGTPRPRSLTKPTLAQLAQILPELEKGWSHNAYLCQQRLEEAAQRNDHNAAKGWAWAGGVATDKIIAIKDGPAPPVVHLHAHRYELGPIFDRLASLRPVAHAQIIAHKPSASDGAADQPGNAP